MGSFANRAAAAALLVLAALGLVLSCRGGESTEGEPQLLLVQMVKRAELDDTTARTIELVDGRSLADLVPAKAFPDGRLPRLPKQPDDSTRIAALMPGCQERLDPVLEEQAGSWVPRFPEPENPVNCVLADYYVAVWDVPDRR